MISHLILHGVLILAGFMLGIFVMALVFMADEDKDK